MGGDVKVGGIQPIECSGRKTDSLQGPGTMLTVGGKSNLQYEGEKERLYANKYLRIPLVEATPTQIQ